MDHVNGAEGFEKSGRVQIGAISDIGSYQIHSFLGYSQILNGAYGVNVIDTLMPNGTPNPIVYDCASRNLAS